MIKKILFTVIIFIMVLIPSAIIHAAENMEVTGNARYDYAFEVLKMVNVERQKEGVMPLSMDKSMIDSAMLRSAELTVMYSHFRPNNYLCFSINNKIYGENIAFGQSSPEEVMNSWMNSQGHRENIMDSSYRSIGIGCFQCKRGVFWVQVFGFEEAVQVYEENYPQNELTTFLVPLDYVEQNMDEDLSDTKENGEKDDCDDGNGFVTPQKVTGFKAIPGKKKITIKWKNQRNGVGYQLQISNNKKYKKSEKYYMSDDSNKLVLRYLNGKRLKSRKKYYVRIRSYAYNNGKDIYSKWNKLTVKVK